MRVALSRRNFTKGLGGLVLAFTFDPAAAQQRQLPGSLGGNRRLDAWIRIDPDGSATVFTGKVELGQGIVTALRQIAAEELDLPLARVTIVSGDTGRTPNEGMTAGSQSVENSGTALRLAAAEVRGILVELASARLGMSADSLSVADGVISAANGRTVSYAELAASLDLKREATATVRPKPAGLHANRRPIDPAPRYSRQGQRRRRCTCRTCGCPAWCTAAWCARRAMARRSSRSTTRRCARCRACSRWCATARSSA